uniref:Uncharacterized protein n=1 Tax=Cacopsylla melanoneura TaxID=428564 RepID=A0A8D8XGI3_9HEMI
MLHYKIVTKTEIAFAIFMCMAIFQCTISSAIILILLLKIARTEISIVHSVFKDYEICTSCRYCIESYIVKFLNCNTIFSRVLYKDFRAPCIVKIKVTPKQTALISNKLTKDIVEEN